MNLITSVKFDKQDKKNSINKIAIEDRVNFDLSNVRFCHVIQYSKPLEMQKLLEITIPVDLESTLKFTFQNRIRKLRVLKSITIY